MECFYGDDRQLYIDPDDCIDCEACIPECPVEAIFIAADVPPKWTSYIQLNADRVKVLKPVGARVTEKQERNNT
jgi:ferredoxin